MLSHLFSWLSRLISGLRSPPSTSESSDTPASSPVSPPDSSNNPNWIDPATFRRAAGLTSTAADRWYPHVRAACLAHRIDTPARIAAWIAQIGHESGGFRFTREIWGPTDAQRRYEGRIDLGNTVPGDGSRYRGRGLIQITGRSNYARAAAALGVDVVAEPEMLETDGMAALSAAWWWSANGCNQLADAGNFDALTRRINGGLNGIEDRRRRHAIAVTALQEAAWT